MKKSFVSSGFRGDRPISVTHSKPPKRRFNPGDLFEYDGEVWKILYMYRIQSEPNVWYHCLEEQKDVSDHVRKLGFVSAMLGPIPPDRVKFEAFRSHDDARTFFSSLFAYGDRATKSTQQLLAMRKLG